MIRKNIWTKYNEADRQEIFKICDGYKKFISDCKTERECVTEMIDILKSKGFKDLDEIIKNNETLKVGDKVYANNMNKAIMAVVIGKESLENGLNILGAHIDSPRIDLKQNPLYENEKLAFFDTHYYGGIKKYQWVTIPLALHGVVAKKDGSLIDIVIGEDENDPVVGISDLLVHLSSNQLNKKASVVIEGEDLNILVGSMPIELEDDPKDEKDVVKKNILNILKEKYNIEEDDFISAEIEAVPAGKARDYGIDRSMVIGYGQDDRVCAYTSLLALLDIEDVNRTAVGLFVDKEEIGSVGATGMHSRFFENTVAEILDRMGEYSELKVRRTIKNSYMLSSDVSAAYDPNYSTVMEKNNSAYFGQGIVFNKYTGSRGKSGSNDANAEYIGKLRKIMDENNIEFQTAELGKVDIGGGGTIAYILGNYNMQVIDCGVALQNMHAPWEVSSKVDIYETYRGYVAFLLNA